MHSVIRRWRSVRRSMRTRTPRHPSRRDCRLVRAKQRGRYVWQAIWLAITLFAASVLGLVIGINFRD